MEPGETVTYRCTKPNVRASFDNVATAVGTPPSGPNVTATDRAQIKVRPLQTAAKPNKPKKPKKPSHRHPQETEGDRLATVDRTPPRATPRSWPCRRKWTRAVMRTRHLAYARCVDLGSSNACRNRGRGARRCNGRRGRRAHDADSDERSPPALRPTDGRRTAPVPRGGARPRAPQGRRRRRSEAEADRVEPPPRHVDHASTTRARACRASI